MRWRDGGKPTTRAGAICSWHSLEELGPSLHHVQNYVESRRRSKHQSTSLDGNGSLPNPTVSRKRKSLGADPHSRDLPLSGLLTPSTSSHLSRENSVISIGSSSSSATSAVINQVPEVYNGELQRKAGRITARRVSWTLHRAAYHLLTAQQSLSLIHI